MNTDVKSRWIRNRYSPVVLNMTIRFTELIAMELSLCAFIQIRSGFNDGLMQTILSFVGLSIVAGLLVFNILLTFWRKIGVIDDHTGYVNPNYKTMFEGLDKRHSTRSATYQLFSLVRKIGFAAILVFMSNFSLPPLIVLQFVSIFMLYAQWTYKPTADIDQRTFSFLNETTLFYFTVSMVTFTAIGPTLQIREYVTYYNIGIICITIVANVIFFVYKAYFGLDKYFNRLNALDAANRNVRQSTIDVKMRNVPTKGHSMQSIHEVAKISHKQPDVSLPVVVADNNVRLAV